MLCEECGKNLATVSITVSAGGEMTTRRLCPDCMKKMQFDLSSGNLQEFLSSVLSVLSSKKAQEKLQCERCGMTYAQFEQTGTLGCAHCYQAFAEQLKPLLQRIHGCTQHVGRAPKGFEAKEADARLKAAPPLENPEPSPYPDTLQTKLEALRKKMDDAVASENFEDAAKYRDEMKSLTRCGEAK